MNDEAVDATQFVSNRSMLLSYVWSCVHDDYRYKIDYESFRKFRRMIYWAGHPHGYIGVSFVDPYKYYASRQYYDDLNHCGFLNTDTFPKKLFEEAKILTIAENAEQDLGSALASNSVKPFKSCKEHWVRAYNNDGSRIDDVLIKWSSRSREVYGDSWFIDEPTYENEELFNIFTNSPFNYLYIKAVLADDALRKQIDEYDFFTDGEVVDTRFGYYSPAYALALLKSLQKYSLCSVLRDFETFNRYHPIDPVTRLCQHIAYERYSDVSYGGEILRAKDMCHNYSMIDRLIEAEDYEDECKSTRDDDWEEEPYYVDGVPVYGASDQEDADILYWNTH